MTRLEPTSRPPCNPQAQLCKSQQEVKVPARQLPAPRFRLSPAGLWLHLHAPVRNQSTETTQINWM